MSGFLLTVYVCTLIVSGPPVIDVCEWHQGQFVYETEDDCEASGNKASDHIKDDDHRVQTFECTLIRML